MADPWRHGPDPRRLRHARNGGPGRVTGRSRIWSHCSQVEGQVLGSGVLQSGLHHVLGVQLGPSVSAILQTQRDLRLAPKEFQHICLGSASVPPFL